MPRIPLLLLVLLAWSLAGPSCPGGNVRILVIGDSHSDPERDPAFDWIAYAPTNWEPDDYATAGAQCWEVVPSALAAPHAWHPNDYVAVFCGTNDAAQDDWDLEATRAWIEMAVEHGLSEGLRVTVVTPPPAFREYPVASAVRNQRLSALRDEIFALAAEYEVEVADVWAETWAHPDPPSLFADGLHFTGPGRLMTSQTIQDAVRRSRSQ